MDSHFSHHQLHALQQIRDLTNGDDDGGPIPAPPPAPSTSSHSPPPAAARSPNADSDSSRSRGPVETFELDDSEQAQGYAYDRDGRPEHHPMHQRHRQRQPSNNTWALVPRPLLALLAFPFHILAAVLRFVLAVLRIPVPQLSLLSLYSSGLWRGGAGGLGWLGARGTARGRRGRAGRDPDAWVRELEEETGAISITRYTKQGNTTAATAVQPGPSTLTARTTNAAALNALFAEALAGRASTSTSYPPDAGADANLNSENGIGIGGGGRKVLPAFFAGTYEEALRTCEREARVGCVVLVSEEHDDTREFKRNFAIRQTRTALGVSLL
ncbi:hypothetical protein CCMSSC00406_0007926 [Pleurotus cornucopiae]|uniref:Uncharacterized protein n=1 Tax=Pleurotus cornucopiae TaxID=5321 RepID=A0ACB7IR10_PLECO|nr:hypothetical protein CCMSSC00406_0007926 [Pleurotus cornucopiae]